ncbi:hypothetical protein ACFL7M_05315 [Thermodesulfobacteriota bacterium]
MIQDKRQIHIKASPENIYDFIETTPNKFPIYKILEIKLFLFLRILFVDGLRSAIEEIGADKPEDVLILNVGDSMGPFTLTEAEKPLKYWFTIRSFFINCKTGYSIYTNCSTTTLHFDTIIEKPRFKEKVWWFLIKPIHGIFANKVLRIIREKVENRGAMHPRINHGKDHY